MYVANIRASKCMKQTEKELKAEIHFNNRKNINAPLTLMGQKNETEDL